MSPVPTLSEQMAQAGSLLGLLLALATLFTAEQSRNLEEERARIGGARGSSLRRVQVLAIALGFVTLCAIAGLATLAWNVLLTVGTPRWVPVSSVFLLVWFLLFALATWQFAIAFKSRSARRTAAGD